jgi:hypothetical protein
MKKTKTEVYLFGGLGNQLFQYFFGQYLFEVKGINVIYNGDYSSLFGQNHGNRLDEYINLNNESSPKKNFLRIGLIRLRILLKIASIWPRMSSSIGSSFSFPSSTYGKENLTEKFSSKYFGYFQTWKFYNYVNGKEIFFSNLRKNFSNDYYSMLKEIQSNDSIGIHLRRGDYLKLTDSYGILGREYYKAALDQLNAKKSSTIYVFSDDIETSKKFFIDLEEIYQFRYLEGLSAIESLLLIGKCTRICISNSTFGYWGALLGEPIEVVAPSKWYRNMSDPIDLIPTNWKKINSVWEHEL